MGAKCCMPVREEMPMILRKKRGRPHELARRNIICSPSWSFRCDNRTHSEEIEDNPPGNSHGNDGGLISELKSAGDMEIESLSDGSSSSDIFQTPKWRKSSNELTILENSLVGTADLSMARSTQHEVNEIRGSSSNLISSKPKPCSTGHADPSSYGICFQTPDPTSACKTYPSPVPALSKEISEGGVLTLDYLSGEGSPSFNLSFRSNDLSAEESHRGSSDGWSIRSFSEFMVSSAFSQRDLRNAQISSPSSFPSDLHACGLCSKLLMERASWNGNEISIAAVLVCGHAYHAECLETVTPEASKFDPSCPTCTHGESSTGKAALVKAGSKTRNKISRRAVADIDVGANFVPEFVKSGSCILKDSRLAASSSQKSTFGRAFLRRHFSIGSRSVKDSPRKHGFWARYR